MGDTPKDLREQPPTAMDRNDGGPESSEREVPWWKHVKYMCIPGMLLTGTSTVVVAKFLYGMKGRTRNGDTQNFEFPWFQTNTMFVGMFGCLIVYEIRRLVGFLLKKRGAKRPESKRYLLEDSTADPTEAVASDGSINVEGTSSHWKSYVYVCAPAMCDLLATGIMNIGLLWIPASVWQMLRGSMIIFSAILSVLFLHRHLRSYHWFAVCVAILGICVVGTATVFGPAPPDQKDADTKHELWGIILTVLAQMVQASQIVIEEFLLKGINLDPLLIVGLEGFWGFTVTSCIVLPSIANIHVNGIHEDTGEALWMFGHNLDITLVAILYMLCILAYNWFGMLVTQQFTAVHRTILEAMRTCFIWVTNLFIYYAITRKHGEIWSDWSFLELIGFLILFFGMLVYNEVIHLPFFKTAVAPAEPLS